MLERKGNPVSSELRAIQYHFKAHHAQKLRKVGKLISRWPGPLYSERIEVGLMLMNLADKIDAAFEQPSASNVVQLRPRSGGDGPQSAA